MTISVVIIDDHTLVRQGVVSLIQAEPDLVVVGEASSIAEGEALLASTRADVMLVDVSLPDGNGIELTRSVREQSPTMGIVVLTMHNDDETLLSALDAGASALVLKSASSEEVVDAVRRAAVAPDAFSATGLAGAMRRHQAAAMARPQLTPREQEVLQHLAAGGSVADVAKALYMSESTVKTHIGKVYDKLGVHNRAAVIMAAVRLGLVKDVAPAASS
jgi:DNA-binding NarL/FixJ family response regulator